jgi:hypothetical protein
VNADVNQEERFEERLLAAMLDDFENLTGEPFDGPQTSRRHCRQTGAAAGRWIIPVAGLVAIVAIAVIAVTSGATRKPAPPVTGPQIASSATPQRGAAATGQQVLYKLASASVRAAPLAGRYVVLRETDTETNQPGQSARTSVIDTANGSSVTYQRFPAGSDAPSKLVEGPDPTSTEAWFAALPTDPTALRARLLAIAKQQATAIRAMESEARKVGKSLPANAAQPSLSDDDYVYEEAEDLLGARSLTPTSPTRRDVRRSR